MFIKNCVKFKLLEFILVLIKPYNYKFIDHFIQDNGGWDCHTPYTPIYNDGLNITQILLSADKHCFLSLTQILLVFKLVVFNRIHLIWSFAVLLQILGLTNQRYKLIIDKSQNQLSGTQSRNKSYCFYVI